MPTKIQLRRGTAAQWTTTNTLLAEGEQGLETDTGKTKIGNGVANWNALPYAGASIGGTDTQVQFNDGGVFAGASGWTWNKTTNTMTLASGTQTADNPAQMITQTWNNASVAFTGVKISISSQNNASGSKLLDIVSNNETAFSINKQDNNFYYGGLLRARSAGLAFGVGDTSVKFGLGFLDDNTGTLGFENGTAMQLRSPSVGGSGVYIAGLLSIGSTNYTTADLTIARDAANTLAQRNGTNAQTFRLYNTFTDASNYERGFMRWNANVFEIGAEAGGTGVARSLSLGPASGGWIFSGSTLTTGYSYAKLHPYGIDVRHDFGGMYISNGVGGWSAAFRSSQVAGLFELIGNGTGAGLQMSEMTAPAAPATNGVRIYAEDNGAGKTRLMALFATGAAVQIAIEP